MIEQIDKSRYDGFDILKCVCAFLVICIHIPFPGVLGEYIKSLSRIAVPVFFMITGFFYRNIIIKENEWKQIKKILLMLAASLLLYFFWDIFKLIIKSESFIEYIKNEISIKNIIGFALLNRTPFSIHLWYLSAILYILLISYFTRRLIIKERITLKYIYTISAILIILGIILSKYSMVIFEKELLPLCCTRNWLFIGIPYFCIGNIIFTHKDIIKGQIKPFKILIGSLVFICISTFEWFFLEINNVNAEGDQYFTTPFLAVSIFIFALTNHNKATNILTKCLSTIGNKLSTMIYIIHPIFISVLNFIISDQINNQTICYFKPFIVFAFSIIFSWLYSKFILYIKKSKNS